MKRTVKTIGKESAISSALKKIRTESKFKASNDKPNISISKEQLKLFDVDFKKSEKNLMARNAVMSVGPDYTCINSDRLDNITHIFLNSVKKKDVKATDQGHSGRCWMFAGLNVFRHTIINALNLENFEFSETYLFFYDKLERCNTFMSYFLDKPNNELSKPELSRYTETMIRDFMSDGGWWSNFANLIKKYGVVPKTAMPETWSSGDSDMLNKVLNDIILGASVKMLKHEEKDRYKIKEDTMKQIYDSLVIFMGHPPKKFTWYFTDEDGESSAHSDITPQQFTDIFFKEIDIDDYVILTHIPSEHYKFYEKYEVENTKNIVEGKNCTIINVPMHELSEHTRKSLTSNIPVWFSGDVSKGFEPSHMALDDKLIDKSLMFGKTESISKGQNIDLFNLSANHAMTITGYNENDKHEIINWQIENSWGYHDHETPGQDGFMCATNDWFNDNVIQICVHKNMLSRKLSKLLTKQPTMVVPWTNMAPALKS